MTSKFDYRRWQYYIIIGVVSFVMIFFLPFIGSEIGLAFQLPNTFAGWLVFIVTKALVAVINMLFFYCFMEQAKINVKDHPKYIEANEILARCGYKSPDYTPTGPDEWNRREYKRKGITISIGSVISAIGLTQAVLHFDWMSMLAYAFIILLGAVFGILQMNVAEEYWTEEYYDYAKTVEQNSKQSKINGVEQGNAAVHVDS